MVQQLLYSFVLNFGPREIFFSLLGERVLLSCEYKGGGLVIGLLHGCPEVVLERVSDGLDVGVLDVRLFALILIVVRVASPVTPRLLELLANMLERVDHDAEVVKALVRDMVVKVLLEGEVHLLEDVVPRDISPRAAAHGCRSVLVPNLANTGRHHVDSCGLLDGVRGVLVLVRGVEEWKKVAPRPVERLVVVAADHVTDREPRKEQLVEEPHKDTKPDMHTMHTMGPCGLWVLR